MTTTETTDPAWLTVGAKVAVLTTTRARSDVDFATVKRITPTRVTLDDGSWFKRDGLSRTETARWSSTKTEVLSPDDSRVLQVIAANEAAHLRSQVIAAFNKWNADRTGPDAAARLDALIAAAQAARATLDTTEEAGQ